MSSQLPETPAGELSAALAPTTSSVRSRTGIPRYAAGLALAGLGWIIPFTGVSGVLIPARLAVLDPVNKVPLVAAIIAIGALTAMITNVIFGNLSDRTRSRLGSRSPWIVIGAILAAVGLALLSTATTVPLLILWWAVSQAGINAVGAALIASIPDRVPNARRGTVSAVYGGAQLLGGTIGSIVAASFISNPTTGFLVFAVIALVLPITFLVTAPDFSNRDVAKEPINAGAIARSFAFPRNAPDFYFALFSRLVILLGYNAVGGYQLYVLTDYMGLDPVAAGGVITQASLLTLVAAFAGAFVFGPLSDKFKRRKPVVITGALLMAVGLAVLLIAAAPWAFLVFAVAGGLGLGIFLSVDAALLSEVLPNEETRGKDLGILNLSGAAGQVLAPAVSAAIIAVGLGFAPVFIAGAALTVLGAALVAPIKKVR